MNKHWKKSYHEIASIMQLNETENIHIICPISYYRNAMENHVPNLMRVLEERGFPDDDKTIWQNQLMLKNGQHTCFIRFIPLYKIKDGALRGLDNFFVVNLCNCEYEYDDYYILFH